MEKEFAPYELAVKLKELGFDEPCFGWYSSVEGNPFRLNYCETYLGIENCTKTPTFSQAFRWFREKYNLKSWIREHTIDTFIYEIRPHKLTNYREGEIYVYKKHEKTELACLTKLIEIIKTKQ